MKKLFCILAAISFVLCACGKDKYETADILIFTQQGCSHCEKAVDFIHNRLQAKNPAIKVVEVDISYDRDNILILKRFLNKYKYDGHTVGTPVIIFNQQLLVGWGLENKVKLQRAFEKEMQR